jgi:diacylglycerol kinase family enzyme
MAIQIHVIINPASGQPEPILNTLNGVFREAGTDWDISISNASGDAHRQAHESVNSGADIVASPSQPVQVDGELAGSTPLNLPVVLQAVGILVAGE